MYIPLYVKTNYSLLSSLITIDELILYCKNNHIPSIAITDNNMFGMMEFYKKCISNNIKPIIGLELKIDNDILLLYAKDYQGYLTLCKLSTIQEEKKLTLEDISKYHDSIIGIIPIKSLDLYYKLSSVIKELYLGYSNKKEEEKAVTVTTNIVYIRCSLYINENNYEYLKYLYMIRDGKTVNDDTSYDINNYSLEIKNIIEYTSNAGLFNTKKIADMCNFSFPKSSLMLPIYEDTNGLSSHDYLINLAKVGLQKRLNNNVFNNYKERLSYELNVIQKMGFSNYFLVVYDFIRYAKKNKILVGPGRGSGAGSLVCYCLGITDIDPIKYDLLFERFLNPERITMPDIDTDFPDIYRDEVINYVIKKYGKTKVSGIVTFGTLAAKQALRDVARVLSIPTYQVDLISKRIPTFTKEKLANFYNNDEEFKNIINSDEKLTLLYKVASVIEGFPRHTSSHAAGIVMSEKDLVSVIPLTVSDGMYLSVFTMEYLEELGLLKMDFLGLKTLGTIMSIISSIEEKEKITIGFNNIPLDDKNVLSLFCNADTTGIFQFESSGMRNFLRKLKPSTFEDIFAAIALFRPGPAVNIDSYIRRKHGEEKIEYLSPCLEPILNGTYGIIVYQEQIMQIASSLAGYTLGEADILRRAMSKKKMDVLKNEEEKFITKSIERGYTYELAKQIFDLILNFANYGFNRSHSVAYSMVAYKMAYLKYYYPKYFYSSLLSSVIGSVDKTKSYIMEVRAKNIPIFKPNINKSSCEYIVDDGGIYFPLSGIRNIGNVICSEIISNRGNGYNSIFNFLDHIRNVNSKALESLIKAGCFDEFGISRKTYIENLDAILNYAELVSTLEPEFVLKPDLIIKNEYTSEELIYMEKDLFGFYLSNHPVTSYKAKQNITISLDNISAYFDKNVVVIVLVDKTKIIQTKNGEDMMFIDGSDEVSKLEFILFPKTYEKNANINVGDIIKINGKVARRYDAFQIVVNNIEKLN